MGVLSLLVTFFGGLLVCLVAVAVLVAGWEWLRQREHLEKLRRDRAVYAATSPLPLAAPLQPAACLVAPLAPAEAAPATAGVSAAGSAVALTTRREPSWIETRPMVLSYTSAVDDEMAFAHVMSGEPDLRLD